MSPVSARTHRAVAEFQVASVVAEAARSVPGVARLQPGLRGLVQQLRRDLWERVGGVPYPDVAGVDATIGDSISVMIDITLVTDGQRPAASIVADVQHIVASALSARLAVPTSVVAVHVCDISLPP